MRRKILKANLLKRLFSAVQQGSERDVMETAGSHYFGARARKVVGRSESAKIAYPTIHLHGGELGRIASKQA
jgi:hypothetical protein